MKFLFRRLILPFLTIGITANYIPVTNAHLMDAQHGTLNFVEDGAYLVVSLPLAAFNGIDEDLSGEVSMIEFNNHRSSIIAAVKRHLVLSNSVSDLELDGIMLSPQLSHNAVIDSVSQVVVLGRFAYTEVPRTATLRVNLFGNKADKQALKITASRQHDGEQRIFSLTPDITSTEIFMEEV